MDSFGDNRLGEADFQRVALTVAYALVNPSELTIGKHLL